MSLMGATNAAISGLAAQSQALATVSNNLANSDTTAYKASKTSFSSLVAGSGASKSGGVSASNTTNNTARGLVVDSAISTNLAIEGDGYLVVSADGDSSSRYYTRNGEFAVDDEGNLVNGDYYLLGWETDENGKVSGGASSVNLTKINLNSVQSSAQPTTKGAFQATMPADAVIGTTFESSFEVYDSLGTASTITATYEKTAQNTWSITYSDPVSADTSTTTGSVTSAPISVTFNNDGTLASVSATSLDITWTTGAANSSIALDLGTVGARDGLTQYSSNDVDNAEIDVKSITVDGRAYGTLKDVEIDSDGSVVASFSNGETRTIYKIPIATVINPDGLVEDSDGIYSISTYSGNATLHTAGSGSAGSLKSSSLESSTVDTSTEFASMLSAQQAYSSASQIISTAGAMFDSLLQAVR
ncbi:flagellar hook protein FlgE [Cohaesibacter haloalkalitolerans]|uniref:flagellar hook protein FlgE n=1 Tax=Cohaesibacter haloalkalitolerans TaxID=1162980 RepID=UPI000E65C337|nr:flagellar hook protein FlgE [Cohaesibacter haloalkalitolerans]